MTRLLDRSRCASGFVAVGSALLANACGIANLDLVDEPTTTAPIVDEQPEAEPSLCDAHPELPSPVKVLLLVDVSASLQTTDEQGARFAALHTLVDRLASEGAAVATLGFGMNVQVSPQIDGATAPLFIPASEWTEPEFLRAAEVQGDLEGVLVTARTHIQADIARTDADELARTRYVVVLFTDSAPTPSCCVSGAERTDEPVDEYGCAQESWEEPAVSGTTYCGAYPEQAMCNDQGFIDRAREANPASERPNYGEGYLQPLNGLSVGGNYNRRGTLEDAARLLGALSQDGVGAVDLNAFTLFDPTLPDNVKAIYGFNACRLQRTIDAVVAPMSGTNELFSSSAAIDFSSVDTTPLCD